MAERKTSKATTEKPMTEAASRPSTTAADAASSDDPSQRSAEIEAEIERTRGELGETAAALAEKADVKQQARQKFEQTKQAAQARLAEGDNRMPVLAAVGGLLVVAVIRRRRRR